MPTRTSHVVNHPEYTLAVGKIPATETESMFRAVLSATDHGVMLSSLDHQLLAANRRFGELFEIDPAEALPMGTEALRARYSPLIVDPEGYASATKRLLDDPSFEQEDEIELKMSRRLVLRRFTAPALDASGRIMGRLWTYQDVTQERRLREMYEIMIRASSEFIADPNESLHQLLRHVVNFYHGTTAILSIRRDDCMDFKAMEGPPSCMSGVTKNKLRDSFCQFAIQALKPLKIQDARLDPVYREIAPVRYGLTRYLGVPIYGDSAEPIGTLCLLDERSDEILDELDMQFMSLLSIRVAAELARERNIELKFAEQKAQSERREMDLLATNTVLDAMNSAFNLLWSSRSLSELLKDQLRPLCGLLGYRGAAIGIRRTGESTFEGFALLDVDQKPTEIEITQDGLDRQKASEITSLEDPSHALSTLLEANAVAYSLRDEEGVGEVLLAFGGPTQVIDEQRCRILLKALADQVCLLMGTHVLQENLVQTNVQLTQAQEQLLRREKLAVVGTLAAGTAHDIKNILASLKLLIAPTSETDDGLNPVREQIGRFDVLAHRLLSYAKPSIAVKEPVDLEKTLESVLALTAAQLRVSKIKLTKELASNLPLVSGDPHEFEHLFVNLILNGVQSMVRNGGTLTLRAEAHTDDVIVTISDTGAGLPPEIESRLFEPFASSRADGFGLGLYSCKRIVENHGGKISAERNPTVGSTFTIILEPFRV